MDIIGITEQGDAGLDFSWEDKINKCKFVILITKNINDTFINKVLKNKNKIIVHATITGFGGTVLEKKVPDLDKSFIMLKKLIDMGFPKEQIVLRLDPIIPTEKGILTALNVLEKIKPLRIKRCRFSFLDMYTHVKNRFALNNIPLPYTTFNAPKQMINNAVQQLINNYGDIYEFEACAELVKNRVGCVSNRDSEILNIPVEFNFQRHKHQRTTCLCCSNKTELLSYRHPCPHKCLYCYWKDELNLKDKVGNDK